LDLLEETCTRIELTFDCGEVDCDV